MAAHLLDVSPEKGPQVGFLRGLRVFSHFRIPHVKSDRMGLQPRGPGPQGDLNISPSWKRLKRSAEMSIPGDFPAMIAARASPIGGAILKPCPLPPMNW